MAYQSFENLKVWKESSELAVEIYKALKQCKDYSLKDQMQRSAVSIASNIAEGSERNSKKEFIQFLHIAKGSAAELRTQLFIASKVGIVNASQEEYFSKQLISISKMLFSLILSLKTENLTLHT